MAGPAQRLPALADLLQLHGPLGGDRHHRADPRPSAQTHPPRDGSAPGAVATVIVSQSGKAAETVGKDPRGYDGAKKINGRKRHLVVDTKGLPPFVTVTPADMTDRDAAKEILFRLRLMHPVIVERSRVLAVSL